MGPAPVQIQAHHASGDHEIQHLMDDIESDRDQQPRAHAFHVQLHSQGRRAIADHGFCDAIDSDWMMSERVLEKADARTREQPGNRTTARHGKKDHDQQRQIENGEERESQRNKRLEKDG